MIESKNYPLKLAKDIENLLREVRKIELTNSDIIKFSDYNTNQTVLRDIDNPEKFFFIVSDPNQEPSNKTSMFRFNFRPHHAETLDESKGNAKGEVVINLLNKWISLIREFNQIKYTEEDTISAFYEREFYDDYEIVEDDADINPFDSIKQKELYQRLLNFRQILEDNADKLDTQELINDTNEVISHVSVSSKRKVVKLLSKLYAKAMKKCAPIMQMVGKEVLTQSVKYEVTHVFDSIHHFLSGL